MDGENRVSYVLGALRKAPCYLASYYVDWDAYQWAEHPGEIELFARKRIADEIAKGVTEAPAKMDIQRTVLHGKDEKPWRVQWRGSLICLSEDELYDIINAAYGQGVTDHFFATRPNNEKTPT